MNSFINTPLFGLSLTLFTYILAKFINKRIESNYLNVTMLAGILIAFILYISKIPLEKFNIGGDYLTKLIAPFILAFAIPLYINIDIIKKNLVPIIIGVLTGIITTAASVLLFGNALGIDSAILKSMTTKSITMAITIELAPELGGILPIAIIMVNFTGIFGAIFIPTILDYMNIKTDLAKGLTFGVISHIIGSNEAGKIKPSLSAYGSVGMCLVCLLAPIVIPMMIFLLE